MQVTQKRLKAESRRTVQYWHCRTKGDDSHLKCISDYRTALSLSTNRTHFTAVGLLDADVSFNIVQCSHVYVQSSCLALVRLYTVQNSEWSPMISLFYLPSDNLGVRQYLNAVSGFIFVPLFLCQDTWTSWDGTVAVKMDFCSERQGNRGTQTDTAFGHQALDSNVSSGRTKYMHIHFSVHIHRLVNKYRNVPYWRSIGDKRISLLTILTDWLPPTLSSVLQAVHY
jgi:hypothetical protein